MCQIDRSICHRRQSTNGYADQSKAEYQDHRHDYIDTRLNDGAPLGLLVMSSSQHHNELTQKAILDENNRPILREEYYIDGILCKPEGFARACKKTNERFRKNQKKGEIKSHHYILSFDPKDKEDNGLTAKEAQRMGMEFAAKNFPGHQALVCTHTDGHNGSGNIHVHIVINSVRAVDAERQDFMERLCDSKAGNKHHLTKDYLKYLKIYDSPDKLCCALNLIFIKVNIVRVSCTIAKLSNYPTRIIKHFR